MNRRFSAHKRDYRRRDKDGTKFSTSWELFNEYGLDNCKIELIENFLCNSKEELHAREGQYQRHIDCINKNVAGRKLKEYLDYKREEISEYRKKFYETHKDRILKQNKECCYTNKEELNRKHREYYRDNNETIKEQMRENYYNNRENKTEQSKAYYGNNKVKIHSQWKEPWTCACGTTLTQHHKARHLKTLKHKTYINQMKQQEPLNNS